MISKDKIVYICGGRSFYENSLGRKLEGVVNSFKGEGYVVEHICGGDLLESSNSPNKVVNYGAQSHYNKWYRQLSFLKIIDRSVSEFRDIKHDILVKKCVEKNISKEKPLVVWERSSRLHKAGLDVSKIHNIPYVLEWKDHLIPYKYSLFKLYAEKVEALKNNQSNYIVVESDRLKTDLVNSGVNKNKIHVAHNAIEPAEFIAETDARDKIRDKYKIDDDTVIIGYLGSYAFYHDVKRLVLAAKLLTNLTSKSYRIFLIGNGENYSEVRKQVEGLGLLDNVVNMIDAIGKNDVPNMLAAMDVAVLPGSTDIICPIKVQEYMYMELASVIPGYDCNKEVIDDNVDGLLFKPGCEVDLANKLLTLIEDKSKRVELGIKAKEKVIKKYTWSETWGKALRNIIKDFYNKE